MLDLLRCYYRDAAICYREHNRREKFESDNRVERNSHVSEMLRAMEFVNCVIISTL